jgi:hypothetical protein
MNKLKFNTFGAVLLLSASLIFPGVTTANAAPIEANSGNYTTFGYCTDYKEKAVHFLNQFGVPATTYEDAQSLIYKMEELSYSLEGPARMAAEIIIENLILYC